MQAPQSRPDPADFPHIATDSTRKEILDREIMDASRKRWRVESHTEFQAVLVRGGHVHHVLHLLLTLITLGLWLPVWIIIAIGDRERRLVVRVDQDGVVVRR